MSFTRVSLIAAIFGSFTVVGCNGFGRVVEMAPLDAAAQDDSGFTITHLDFYVSNGSVEWSVDGKSVPTDHIIGRLDERLKALGGVKKRVVIVHPKNWDGGPDPLLLWIRAWAHERKVSLRIESARGHIRGVTFGKGV